ncbi:SDR family oxidoreductase [Pseudoduganella namucuonensis]|uniref:NAD(P)-dependent dehydrogenase, short-chain alcohol dehydrogenase family n=1 Tax=Pseudoduganella namucuonensis TaxID=1035707 RepID=A0A1I7HEN4_9BURK|nr:SDR family oxidoreductase [Pseudoduganella namucuonensis]SFU59131.1 NAD(P)-dependent dehydrogenase, short-chain alcohol dehydrogenase family [Pseudoduganella namucuonensis]
MKKLEGKIALITGGTSGIGLAAARLFREQGAQLVLTGRDPGRIAEAAEEFGGGALVLRSEAGNLKDIDDLMTRVREHYGRLDVLFLNAAVTNPAPIELVTEAMFDEVVDVNFKGEFFTIQKALPLMGAGSTIVVTTSITNQTGSPAFSVYGASKAALRSLVQSLSLALIPQGIRINAICPGPIDTGGFQRLPLPAEVHSAVKADISGRSPIKRFGTPDEVAKVALFLASEDSAYVVGEEIVIDGGISHVCLP